MDVILICLLCIAFGAIFGYMAGRLSAFREARERIKRGY